jgi:hypothetical protein
MRIAGAVLMLVHAVAHLPGFLVSWKLATFAELPYKSTLLAGRLPLGDRGVQLAGVVWLVLALGFALSGVAALARLPWWSAVATVATAVSLVLCVLAWPDTRFGVLVNLVLGTWLLWGTPR